MWTGAGGSLIGALAALGGSFFQAYQGNASNKKAAKRNYVYYLRSLVDGPARQREGLEKAGYNPMLAAGGLGSASFSPSVGGFTPSPPDIAGSAKAGAMISNAIKEQIARIDNVEADTKLKKGQLDAVETQRLQTEANTSLLQSQAERSDLAYGRDIADTITGIAGTAGSLYSAKAMRDIARTPKETVTTIHHGDKTKPTEIIKTHGVPAVDSSANPKTKPNAVGVLGSSAKSAGRIAKEVAKDILFGLPLGIVGAGVGAGMSHVREREVKEHLKKSKDTRRKWYHNFDRFHFDY